MKKSLIIAIFCTVLTNTQNTWVFDTLHSTVGFSTNHMVISEIDGQFTHLKELLLVLKMIYQLPKLILVLILQV